MSNKKLGDSNLTFEEALVESIRVESREFDPSLEPDLESVKTWTLKEGTRAYKIAKYWTIKDRHTGDIHHHVLTLETINRVKKANGWLRVGKNTITLNDEEGDEIGRLLDGLASIPQFSGRGEYIIINPRNPDDNRLKLILSAISTSGRKVDLLAEVLSWANDDPRVTAGLVKLAAEHPIRSKSLAAGLNYGRYKKALDELRELIAADHVESVYQEFLEEQIWMFGSEYSELLPKRALALGIQLDFPLRRTVDGYLEIIEIKTPLNGKTLFLQDASHDNLYPRTELNQHVAQARKYLRIVDAEQYRIEARDKLLVEKVRAKVIVGRDYEDTQQIEALRQLNADQHRVEVITFDQLVRIAERILEILGDEASLSEDGSSYPQDDFPPSQENLTDIPF